MNFDSREYEWADVTCMIGTRSLSGFTAINYSSKQNKEPIYGKGNEPYAIQKGNKSHEGELEVSMSELLALKSESQTGSILDMHIDITVCYGNPSQGDVMQTHKLLGVEFTDEPKGMKQGDTHSTHRLPFIFLREL